MGRLGLRRADDREDAGVLVVQLAALALSTRRQPLSRGRRRFVGGERRLQRRATVLAVLRGTCRRPHLSLRLCGVLSSGAELGVDGVARGGRRRRAQKQLDALVLAQKRLVEQLLLREVLREDFVVGEWWRADVALLPQQLNAQQRVL